MLVDHEFSGTLHLVSIQDVSSSIQPEFDIILPQQPHAHQSHAHAWQILWPFRLQWPWTSPSLGSLPCPLQVPSKDHLAIANASSREVPFHLPGRIHQLAGYLSSRVVRWFKGLLSMACPFLLTGAVVRECAYDKTYGTYAESFAGADAAFLLGCLPELWFCHGGLSPLTPD